MPTEYFMSVAVRVGWAFPALGKAGGKQCFIGDVLGEVLVRLCRQIYPPCTVSLRSNN